VKLAAMPQSIASFSKQIDEFIFCETLPNGAIRVFNLIPAGKLLVMPLVPPELNEFISEAPSVE
jgi:hypothetical protein